MLSEFRPRIWPWAKFVLAQCTGFYTFIISLHSLYFVEHHQNEIQVDTMLQAQSTLPRRSVLIYLVYSVSAGTGALPTLDRKA